MRASELMIGDWVNLSPSDTPNQNYVKIHAIDYDGEISKDHVCDIAFLSTGAIQYNYSISSLKPIPLTPKILERIGFINGEFFASSHIEGWQILSDGGHLAARSEHGWCIDIPCHYVHELQHAFKLVGINKEITL